jgi:hypothetical protein
MGNGAEQHTAPPGNGGPIATRGPARVAPRVSGRRSERRDAFACRVTGDELRCLVAALPDGDVLPGGPRGYAVNARPTAPGAEAAGTDLATLDSWVIAHRGQLRTARFRSSTRARPGRRRDPAPSSPRRFYLVPSEAKSA